MNVIKFLFIALITVTSATADAKFCNFASKTIAKVSGAAAAVTVAAGSGLSAFGVMALPHIGGGLIAATSAGTYISGTLGVVGAGVGILTAPATLVIGGITLAAAGSTIAVCGL